MPWGNDTSCANVPPVMETDFIKKKDRYHSMYVSQSLHNRFGGALLILFCPHQNTGVTQGNLLFIYSFLFFKCFILVMLMLDTEHPPAPQITRKEYVSNDGIHHHWDASPPHRTHHFIPQSSLKSTCWDVL